MVSPALAQLPGAGNTFCHISWTLSGRSANATQRIGRGIRKHWTKGLVALCHLGDSNLQIAEFCIGGAIDSTQAKLHTKIQKQLVTA